ncbi:Tyrosine-specific transport system [Linum perenne]
MYVSSFSLQIPSSLLKPLIKHKPLHAHHHFNSLTSPLYHHHQLPIHFPTRPKPITFICRSQEQQEYVAERLFSNLNQATFKREPGSLPSAISLVAGTTVGAGILAIPAVTQESGFLASAFACITCWIFMVATGLLIAEVNVNTMCELGSGGVSLVSMAKRTLGSVGVQVACWSYIFIHYALLVAYVARSSDIITNNIGIPLWESAALFSLVLGSICYFGRSVYGLQRFI